MQIKGKYNTAHVYAEIIEDSAINQIETLCNQKFSEGSKIAIMPDVHSGAGCTIGTTMTISDKVCPNLVGVDIGCGMYCVKLDKTELDLQKLDLVVHQIPHGFDVWDTVHREFDITALLCFEKLNNVKRLKCSMGTLGGGNHFIELDQDDEGNLYLVIHSGSRNLGVQVAKNYQNLAVHNLRANKELFETLPRDLCYVEGDALDNYLHDVAICQHWAKLSRETMAEYILKKMNLKAEESFHTIHNYIDVENHILRKGAISAQEGERLLIPINMRDGAIIGYGKGNPDWNFSAPHGAGRLISRTQAMKELSVKDFEKSMDGIYTTCVGKSTLDESPMAYKPIDAILKSLTQSVEISKIIKPIYNFKSSEDFSSAKDKWKNKTKQKYKRERFSRWEDL